MQMVPFSFRSIEELELGPKWAAIFEERWPHYREWFLREGEEARPSYATSARMLRAHMPELMDAYERVVELAGGGDLAARMLSLYRPPPYLAACSQGVWSGDDGPMLVRNYDYAPSRMEGIIWSTRLGERRVIGMSDCLWGLLDGRTTRVWPSRSRSAGDGCSAMASGSRSWFATSWRRATTSCRPGKRWRGCRTRSPTT